MSEKNIKILRIIINFTSKINQEKFKTKLSLKNFLINLLKENGIKISYGSCCNLLEFLMREKFLIILQEGLWGFNYWRVKINNNEIDNFLKNLLDNKN